MKRLGHLGAVQGHVHEFAAVAMQARFSQLSTRCSLRTTHYPLQSAEHSLLTAHYALRTTHYALRTTHCSLRLYCDLLLTSDSRLLTTDY